jgi:hypothetical protein
MTDPIERLRALHSPVAMADVEAILGPPQHDIGSGIYIFTYALDDGTVIRVGTADRQRVLYIRAGEHVLFQDR